MSSTLPYRLSRHRPRRGFLALLLLIAAPSSFPMPQQPSPIAMQLEKNYAKLPLGFEVNRGQFDAPVRYLAQGPGYTLFMTADEAVLSLKKKGGAEGERSIVRTKLLGAKSAPALTAEDPQPGRSNYLRSNDRSRWVRDVERYGRVRYSGVYPGVDLVYYGNQGQLEYDFVVAPEADPSPIRMHYAGVDGARLTQDGELHLAIGAGELQLKRPVVYQTIAGERVPVSGKYSFKRRDGGVDVAFRVGRYDRSQALVIDPVLVYSTYLGGAGADIPNAIAVDAAGNAYVTGSTASTGFPTTTPPCVRCKAGAAVEPDAFVSKFSNSGELVYSTYLGGERSDIGRGIAVNSPGQVYVTGQTESLMFPVQAALPGFDTKLPSDFPAAPGADVFVSQLSANGQDLLYSTYLGGRGRDIGNAIALDPAGSIYLTGETSSTTGTQVARFRFPTVNAAQPNPKSIAGSEAFVVKIAPNGRSLLYSTFLGGNQIDSGLSIAVDSTLRAYVVGSTDSSDFLPQALKPSAVQGDLSDPPQGRPSDAFLIVLSAPAGDLPGGAFAYGTYLGGTGTEIANSVALDANKRVYLTGRTDSNDFPRKNALDTERGFTALSETDAFVSVLDITIAGAGGLLYSSYLGGASSDVGRGIDVDGDGKIYVAGSTSSAGSTSPTGFPVMGAFQTDGLGGGDAFVTVFDALTTAGSTRLMFSSLFGGTGADEASAIAVDADAQIYIAGTTTSTDLKTEMARQPANAGGTDGFVARIGEQVTAGPGQLAFAAAAIPVAEDVAGGTLTIPVSRNGGNAMGVASVTYTITDGTALAGSDYTAEPPQTLSGVLSWADGDDADKNITVRIVDDADTEENENFVVTLSAANGATLGSPSVATVTISANDGAQPSTIQLDADSYNIGEGGGTVTVSATRSGGTAGAATVRYRTANGTGPTAALANSDYTATMGRLRWEDGEGGSKTVMIPILQDELFEGRHSFSLTIDDARGGATIATPATATINILDDENGRLSLSAAEYTVNEPATMVTITVRRTMGASGAVSVNYATQNGNALDGADYTAQTGTLNWADLDAAPKTFTVPITNDADYEGPVPETFSVTLTAPGGGATLVEPTTATVMIRDDERLFGNLRFSAPSYSAAENAGVVELTVERVDGAEEAVSVRYTTRAGTATGGSDYNETSAVLRWANGDAEPKTLRVQLLNDEGSAEGDETFDVVLSEAGGGAGLGGPAEAVVTIADDEVAFAGNLRLAEASYEVDESAGTVAVSVLRGGSSEGAVSVAYKTMNGEAASGSDYLPTSGRLNWAAGDLEPKMIEVQILDNTAVDGGKNFSVVLDSPSGGVTLDDPRSTNIVISDASDGGGSGGSGGGGSGAIDWRLLALLIAAAMLRIAVPGRRF